jgi:signal transduction histidine kinase
MLLFAGHSCFIAHTVSVLEQSGSLQNQRIDDLWQCSSSGIIVVVVVVVVAVVFISGCFIIRRHHHHILNVCTKSYCQNVSHSQDQTVSNSNYNNHLSNQEKRETSSMYINQRCNIKF